MGDEVRIWSLADLLPQVAEKGRGNSFFLDKEVSDNVEVLYQRIRPGNMGTYHYHKKAENIWIVLQGELEAIIGDVRYLVPAGQVIYMPNVIPHATGNRGTEDMLAVEIYVPPHGHGTLDSPGKDGFTTAMPSVIRDAAELSKR